MLFMMHCDFDMGVVKNEHFQSTLLGVEGGASKKNVSMLCMLFIMLTIMDDPLPHYQNIINYLSHTVDTMTARRWHINNALPT